MELSRTLTRRYEDLYRRLVKSENIPYPSSLDAEIIERILSYIDLLKLWTVKVDLVGPASREVLLERHIIDSIAAGLVFWSSSIPVDSEGSYVDVGSGAGLPGLVFGIFEPQRTIILCEPRAKRAVFLKEAIGRLELENVFAVCSRAEDLNLSGFPDPTVFWARALGTGPLLTAARRSGNSSSHAVELAGPNWEKPADIKEDLAADIHYTLEPDGPQRRLVVWSPLRA